jgi:cell division protein FtsL
VFRRKSSEKTTQPQAQAPAAPRRKVPPDIYTVFLAIALVAILVAILFLYLEMNAYEFKSKAMPVAMAGWRSELRVQDSRFRVQDLSVYSRTT